MLYKTRIQFFLPRIGKQRFTLPEEWFFLKMKLFCNFSLYFQWHFFGILANFFSVLDQIFSVRFLNTSFFLSRGRFCFPSPWKNQKLINLSKNLSKFNTKNLNLSRPHTICPKELLVNDFFFTKIMSSIFTPCKKFFGLWAKKKFTHFLAKQHSSCPEELLAGIVFLKKKISFLLWAKSWQIMLKNFSAGLSKLKSTSPREQQFSFKTLKILLFFLFERKFFSIWADYEQHDCENCLHYVLRNFSVEKGFSKNVLMEKNSFIKKRFFW